MNKNYILLIIGLLSICRLPSNLNAQNTDVEGNAKYVITSISYDIDGLVLVSAIKKKTGLEEGNKFDSIFALERYIEDARQKLMSESVFNRSLTTITFVHYWSEEQQQYNVEVFIYATPKGSLLVLPYPKYTTDGGFTLAMRLRDYNFLGTLDTLAINADWNIKQNEDESFQNNISLSTSIPYSWSFGKHRLSSNVSAGGEYGINNKKLKTEIRGNLSYGYPLTQRVGYSSSVSLKETSYYIDDNIHYDQIRNYHFLVATIRPFGFGFQLNKVPIDYYIGNIGYSISGSYRQDIPLYSSYYIVQEGDDEHETAWFSNMGGEYTSNSDFNATRLNGYPSVSHSIGLGTISNVEGTYFRRGFNASLGNSWTYNIREGLLSDRGKFETVDPLEGWSGQVTLNSRAHILLWNTVGINLRGSAVQNIYFHSPYKDITGSGSSFDSSLRGITSDNFKGVYRGAYLNTDIMVKLGQIILTKLFSAEIHMGPLMDIAIRDTTQEFDADQDFKVTAGIQGIAFNLNYAIQIVGWYGFDVLRAVEDSKASTSSLGFVREVWNKKEIYVGTALFY